MGTISLLKSDIYFMPDFQDAGTEKDSVNVLCLVNTYLGRFLKTKVPTLPFWKICTGTAIRWTLLWCCLESTQPMKATAADSRRQTQKKWCSPIRLQLSYFYMTCLGPVCVCVCVCVCVRITYELICQTAEEKSFDVTTSKPQKRHGTCGGLWLDYHR